MLECEDEDEIVEFAWLKKVLIIAQDCENDQGEDQDQRRIRLGWEVNGKWMTTKGGLISWISLVSKGGWGGLGLKGDLGKDKDCQRVEDFIY